METYDVIVVGAGPGGYPAAIRAAQLGAKTALVEREWLGGTCLNCGCIPTKALIAGAERLQQVREAKAFGIETGEVTLDYRTLHAHKNKVVQTLGRGVQALLKGHGVTVYEGQAEFEAPQRIAVVKGKEKTRVRAPVIVVATGSVSAMPGFLPRHPRVVESRALLEHKELPRRLLVLGGGYIGCELACMAAAAGVRVTIVEMLADILMLLDEESRAVVRRGMEKHLGIEILTGDALQEVQADDTQVSATAGGRALAADLLLVAVGRVPVTDGLQLERAGLATDERGTLAVDEYSRTAVPGVYAVGDVTGRVQLAHAATSHGVAAIEYALGHARKPAETLVPGVIFTMPEVAMAGLSESEARERGRATVSGRFAFQASGRALAAGVAEGFVRWLADDATGQLLGATAVGPHATDLIGEACVAIRAELTAEELGRTIHAHPTFPEVWMEAAHDVMGHCIHAPPRRKR